MERLTRAEIKEVFDKVPSEEDKGIVVSGGAVDSRVFKKGDVFFAMVGDHVNGHQFVEEILRRKAAAVVANPKYLVARLLDNPALIEVDDTEAALLKLARHVRSKYKIPFIGVTGSTGKTTTKEILATLLSEKYQVLKSSGNLNTEIGLPLNLLRLNAHHHVAVLELGAHKKGDIRLLAELLTPRYGIVTNVGHSHLQYFKTKQNVADEKAELVKSLPPNGVAILNYDDARVRAMGKKTKAAVISFGIEEDAEVMASKIETYLFQTRFHLKLKEQEYEISIPLSGRHNVYNCLAAVAAASAVGLEAEHILLGLRKLKVIKQRGEILVRRGLTIINDTYNANPESMLAALEFLSQLDAKRRKFVVLGDMLELGEISEQAHIKIGELIAERGFEQVYTYGKLAALISEAALKNGMGQERCHHFSDKGALYARLEKDLQGSEIILLKASRGMALESIAARLQQN